MAQTRLKSGNLHMVGGDNGSDGNVLKSKGDGTMEWGVVIVNPTFSSFDYPGDDTALDPAGNQSLVINGGGFNVGVTVTIDGTTCSSITRNSATQLTVTTPAKSAGSQALVITNTDGGSASTNVSYNGIPAFTNAAGSLASVKSGATINVSAAATEPDGGTITYAITSGSLPSGLSLNTSTGAITGTAPDVSADTTSNFTVTATDDENQSTARAYSITITPILPSDSFQVVTYTGNGGTQSINVGFKPDFVWIKQRNATNHHRLLDSTRGATKILYSSLSYAEDTESTGLTAFTSTGFNLGAQQSVNDNNDTYVAWCWKAGEGTTSSNTDGSITSTVQTNTDAGFSIIQYTGTGSAATIGHGLGVAPDIIFSKRTSSSADWVVGINDWTKYLELNGNPGFRTASSVWNNTAPTSTVFSVAGSGGSNGNGATNIAYAFKSIDGFSKIGSYTGNGNANGPIQETGFEPAFIMVKRTNAISNWVIYDNKRNTTNPRFSYLLANENSAETGTAGDAAPQLDFLSNGFQPSGTEGYVNANGDNYIYMAFAADPDTTAPTLADSFSTKLYTGNGGTQSVTGAGFKPDMVWLKNRTTTASHLLHDSVRGTGSTKSLHPNHTPAEGQLSSYGWIDSFDNDGFSVNASSNGHHSNRNGDSYVAWSWKGNDDEPAIGQITEDAAAIAVYKFEDDVDDVSNNYDLTATNISYATGKFNKSAVFNGSSSYAQITSSAPQDTSGVMSVSFWAKTTSTSRSCFFIAEGPSSAREFLKLENYGYQGTNSLRVSYNNSMLGNIDNQAISDGQWHHIVVTAGSGNVRTYVDNTLVATQSVTIADQTLDHFAIGWRKYNTDLYFNGEIDQFRIFNKELTEASVNTLYYETTAQNSTLNIGTKAPTSDTSIVSANANAGFSIVKWTGTGSAGEVPHGLSAAPEMIITKRLNGAGDWYTYHKGLNSGTNPAYNFIKLNSDAAEIVNASSGGSIWNSTSPSSTVINVGTTLSGSTSDSYIAYCFHSVSGYSKFGSYTGTGSANNTVTVGFQPDFVMVKATSTNEPWFILDSARDTSNPRDNRLMSDSDAAEDDGSVHTMNFNSTNFTLNGTTGNGTNGNGQTYIYMAFKIN